MDICSLTLSLVLNCLLPSTNRLTPTFDQIPIPQESLTPKFYSIYCKPSLLLDSLELQWFYTQAENVRFRRQAVFRHRCFISITPRRKQRGKLTVALLIHARHTRISVSMMIP